MQTKPLLHYASHCPQDNTTFIHKILPLLKLNDKILLKGDVGAGKTHLVRQILHALGLQKSIVASPSFPLVNQYQLNVSYLPETLKIQMEKQYSAALWHVKHIDLYRIHDTPASIKENLLFELGWEEWMFDRGLVFLEWSENFQDIVELCNRKIEIQFSKQGRNFFLF